ncbi:MAG TPA: PfkB family carbohydrate kinase [Gaiellaceae bacterium]|jgi:5-dehydro-2-deoxygluconokinase|nr:PfkB family carbohydrate kinase [Gaiellaceae bacterium]
MGRVGVDLYPTEIRTPLRAQRTFERFVGGFAGNVATGLARLGVRAAIVSRVGDEGNGQFVRDYLDAEGVDTRFLAVDPYWLTPPTFVEVWPPDDFPITFYRRPTCPDWQLSPEDFDGEEVAAAPLLYATGTGLAQSPSRETTLDALRSHRGTTVFDLDWRPTLWDHPREYPPLAAEAIEAADLLIGGEAEIEAAGTTPEQVAAAGKRIVVKRGERGASIFSDGHVVDVQPRPVDVLNGLGAGDAFAAALGHALLRGRPLVEAVHRGSAAGAIVATRLACSEAMPRLEELEGALA